MCFHCRNYFIYFFPSWRPHLPYKSQSTATEHSLEMGCLIHRCVWHSGSLLLYVEVDCRVNLVWSLSDGLSDHDYYTFLKLSKIKHRKWNKQTKINKEKIVKWMKSCSCGFHVWMISWLKKKKRYWVQGQSCYLLHGEKPCMSGWVSLPQVRENIFLSALFAIMEVVLKRT